MTSIASVIVIGSRAYIGCILMLNIAVMSANCFLCDEVCIRTSSALLCGI